MPKKLLITTSVLLILVGLSFYMAKKVPCNAETKNCSENLGPKPILASRVDKRVSISDYSATSVQKSLDEHKRVILFFQASWCSTCYLIEQDFQNSASQIPSDVVISRVNIDKNKDLKDKYSVVAQDEMVEITQNWKEISHWKSSERAVEELLINLK